MNSIFKICVLFLFTAPTAMAADMGLGQGRLFLGSAKPSPTELNTELTAQGIKNIDLNNQYGIEITFPTFQYLSLGLRYTHHVTSQEGSLVQAYKAEISQDGLMGVARVPLFKSDIVHFDIFAAGGVNKTTYTEKSATQDGFLESSASPTFAAGASVAVGYQKYFLFLEGGFESNKVESLTRSGTVTTNVNTIDLSGSYVLLGVMFDGIPVFSK
ncbi:MAG: hypothetical protein HUU57_08880 [Bdellovibrio sp.]|nr:hypothetical protein [Bdellovibrio sp.]